MKKLRIEPAAQLVEKEWVSLPGGELQAPKPTVLCPACRERRIESTSNPSTPVICFSCHRATLERERALKAAGQLNTASEARFQSALPFEPVNQPRLARLRQDRAAARAGAHAGAGQYVDKRRHAQIAARHALERIINGLRARNASPEERDRVVSSAIRAAELQLPAAWLPFVMSR